MKRFVLCLAILCAVLLFSVVGIVGAETYTFDTGVPPGMTLGGSMTWNGVGGGHLYCEQYFDDDLIVLSPDVYLNSFQMNAMPWEGFEGGDIGLIDIAAFDSVGNQVWNTTVDLTDYTDWSNWLTVSVETDNVSKIIFYSPFNRHGNGFWPSIDNMVVNEASKASINGHVTDKETGNAIAQALVIALQKPTRVRTTTDNLGFYEILDLSEGTWRVLCWKRGYQFQIQTVTLAPGDTKTVDFDLAPKTAQGDDDIPSEFK